MKKTKDANNCFQTQWNTTAILQNGLHVINRHNIYFERCFRDFLPTIFLMILTLLFPVSWITAKSSNNFLMDKCDIKHDTKCDIYVIAALKLNVQTKIEGSDREIRDGVVTP